jgi:hypothetical protein
MQEMEAAMRRYVYLLVLAMLAPPAAYGQGCSLYSIETVIGSGCDGGAPAPDGTAAMILWDANSNGPDPFDPLAPLCEWEQGGFGVNINAFTFNGEELGMGPGTFWVLTPFDASCVEMIVPNRFYVQVCFANVIWNSTVFSCLPGAWDIPLDSWTCLSDTFCSSCPPPPPPSIAASDNMCSEVILTWSTWEGVDSFLIYRDNSLLARVPASISQVTLTCSPAGPALYCVRAITNCAVGAAACDWGGCRQIPGIPTGFRIRGNPCGIVAIEWDVSPNADSYRLERNGSLLAELSAPTHTYTDLCVGASPVEYCLRAGNTCGISAPVCSTAHCRVGPPQPPTSITASDDLCGQVVVHWAGHDPDADLLHIYRDSIVVASAPPTANDWVDQTAEGRYSYRVGALDNACGESISTVQDSGTAYPQVRPPVGLHFVAPPICDTIRIAWAAGGAEAPYFIIERDGVVIDTTEAPSYADGNVHGSIPRLYTVVARSEYCLTSAETGPVAGVALPAVALGELADTVACTDPLCLPVRHCGGADARGDFLLSLGGQPFALLQSVTPIPDTVCLPLSDTLRGPYHARILAIAYHAERIDSAIGRPFVLDCRVGAITCAAAGGPDDFVLEPNSPNPFNVTTRLTYYVPRTAHVRLLVFDVTGRVVATIRDGVVAAGVQRDTFDGSRLASGIYFTCLETGAMKQTRKMVLLK